MGAANQRRQLLRCQFGAGMPTRVTMAVRTSPRDPNRASLAHAEGTTLAPFTGELRSVAHHDRRREEAAKFGLGAVISPETAPTLRQALKLATRAAARPAAATA